MGRAYSGRFLMFWIGFILGGICSLFGAAGVVLLLGSLMDRFMESAGPLPTKGPHAE